MLLSKANYKKYLIFCLFMFILKPNFIFGRTVRYEEVLEAALRYSPRIKEKVYEIDIAHAVYKQSISNFYPQISIGSRLEKFENLTETTRFLIIGNQVIGGQPDEWRAGLYLSGEFYLSNLYKRWYDISYYRLLKDVVSYECQSEVKNLIKNVTDLYSKVLEAKIKLRYSELIVDKLRKIHELQKIAYEKGEISYEDLLKTEAEIETALREQTNIKRDLNVYLSDLSWITGEKFSPSDEFIKIPSKGKIYEIVNLQKVENLSEYKAQVKQVEAFEKRFKSVKMSFLPDIVIYIRYDLYGSSLNTFEDALGNVKKTAFIFGFFISMPLFDGGRIKWEKIRTLYELERQKERLKSVRIEKGREIEELYLTYIETKKNLQRYENLLKHYLKISQIEKRAYELGERSKIEFLEIEKDLLGLKRDKEITENTLAYLERKIEIETEENSGDAEYNFGYNRTCKY